MRGEYRVSNDVGVQFRSMEMGQLVSRGRSYKKYQIKRLAEARGDTSGSAVEVGVGCVMVAPRRRVRKVYVKENVDTAVGSDFVIARDEPLSKWKWARRRHCPSRAAAGSGDELQNTFENVTPNTPGGQCEISRDLKTSNHMVDQVTLTTLHRPDANTSADLEQEQVLPMTMRGGKPIKNVSLENSTSVSLINDGHELSEQVLVRYKNDGEPFMAIDDKHRKNIKSKTYEIKAGGKLEKGSTYIFRRFRELRKSINKNLTLPTMKDASVTSDPPSLESHSVASERRQAVKRMFKNIGKKYSYEGAALRESPVEKSKTKTPLDHTPNEKGDREKSVYETIKESLLDAPPVKEANKKKTKGFSFFKKRLGKDKTKNPKTTYKNIRETTTDHCGVGDGLSFKILPKIPVPVIESKSVNSYPTYEEIINASWLLNFLTTGIESNKSVKVRWDNGMHYATSSSTGVHVIDNVYRSNSLAVTYPSSEYTRRLDNSSNYRNSQVKFTQQLYAYMLPKLPHWPSSQRAKGLNKSSNYIVTASRNRGNISDYKMYTKKTKAISNKIKILLNSRSLVPELTYLKTDIPKDFFSEPGSDVPRPEYSSDEQVFKITEYESEVSRLFPKDSKVTFKVSNSGDYQNEIARLDEHNSLGSEVTTSMQETSSYETMKESPQIRRDFTNQGRGMYRPMQYDVIGIGIIPQRNALWAIAQRLLNTIKCKPNAVVPEANESTLKQSFDVTELLLPQQNDYGWPAPMDLFPWGTSDTHLQCCRNYPQHKYRRAAQSCPFLTDNYYNFRSCSSQIVSSNKKKTVDSKIESLDSQYSVSEESTFQDRIFAKYSQTVFRFRKFHAEEKSEWFTNVESNANPSANSAYYVQRQPCHTRNQTGSINFSRSKVYRKELDLQSSGFGNVYYARDNKNLKSLKLQYYRENNTSKYQYCKQPCRSDYKNESDKPSCNNNCLRKALNRNFVFPRKSTVPTLSSLKHYQKAKLYFHKNGVETSFKDRYPYHRYFEPKHTNLQRAPYISKQPQRPNIVPLLKPSTNTFSSRSSTDCFFSSPLKNNSSSLESVSLSSLPNIYRLTSGIRVCSSCHSIKESLTLTRPCVFQTVGFGRSSQIKSKNAVSPLEPVWPECPSSSNKCSPQSPALCMKTKISLSKERLRNKTVAEVDITPKSITENSDKIFLNSTINVSEVKKSSEINKESKYVKSAEDRGKKVLFVEARCEYVSEIGSNRACNCTPGSTSSDSESSSDSDTDSVCSNLTRKMLVQSASGCSYKNVEIQNNWIETVKDYRKENASEKNYIYEEEDKQINMCKEIQESDELDVRKSEEREENPSKDIRAYSYEDITNRLIEETSNYETSNTETSNDEINDSVKEVMQMSDLNSDESYDSEYEEIGRNVRENANEEINDTVKEVVQVTISESMQENSSVPCKDIYKKVPVLKKKSEEDIRKQAKVKEKQASISESMQEHSSIPSKDTYIKESIAMKKSKEEMRKQVKIKEKTINEMEKPSKKTKEMEDIYKEKGGIKVTIKQGDSKRGFFCYKKSPDQSGKNTSDSNEEYNNDKSKSVCSPCCQRDLCGTNSIMTNNKTIPKCCKCRETAEKLIERYKCLSNIGIRARSCSPECKGKDSFSKNTCPKECKGLISKDGTRRNTCPEGCKGRYKHDVFPNGSSTGTSNRSTSNTTSGSSSLSHTNSSDDTSDSICECGSGSGQRLNKDIGRSNKYDWLKPSLSQPRCKQPRRALCTPVDPKRFMEVKFPIKSLDKAPCTNTKKIGSDCPCTTNKCYLKCPSCCKCKSPPLVPNKGSNFPPPLVPNQARSSPSCCKSPSLVPKQGSNFPSCCKSPPPVPNKGSSFPPPLVPNRGSNFPSCCKSPPLVPNQGSNFPSCCKSPPLVPNKGDSFPPPLVPNRGSNFPSCCKSPPLVPNQGSNFASCCKSPPLVPRQGSRFPSFCKSPPLVMNKGSNYPSCCKSPPLVPNQGSNFAPCCKPSLQVPNKGSNLPICCKSSPLVPNKGTNCRKCPSCCKPCPTSCFECASQKFQGRQQQLHETIERVSKAPSPLDGDFCETGTAVEQHKFIEISPPGIVVDSSASTKSDRSTFTLENDDRALSDTISIFSGDIGSLASRPTTVYPRKSNGPIETAPLIDKLYQSSVHLVSAVKGKCLHKKSIKQRDNEHKENSESIQINFKLKMTPGDNMAEIKIGSENVDPPTLLIKESVENIKNDIYMMKTCSHTGIKNSATNKNALNVRIIIKNCSDKTKTMKSSKKVRNQFLGITPRIYKNVPTEKCTAVLSKYAGYSLNNTCIYEMESFRKHHKQTIDCDANLLAIVTKDTPAIDEIISEVFLTKNFKNSLLNVEATMTDLICKSLPIIKKMRKSSSLYLSRSSPTVGVSPLGFVQACLLPADFNKFENVRKSEEYTTSTERTSKGRCPFAFEAEEPRLMQLRKSKNRLSFSDIYFTDNAQLSSENFASKFKDKVTRIFGNNLTDQSNGIRAEAVHNIDKVNYSSADPEQNNTENSTYNTSDILYFEGISSGEITPKFLNEQRKEIIKQIFDSALYLTKHRTKTRIQKIKDLLTAIIISDTDPELTLKYDTRYLQKSSKNKADEFRSFHKTYGTSNRYTDNATFSPYYSNDGQDEQMFHELVGSSHSINPELEPPNKCYCSYLGAKLLSNGQDSCRCHKVLEKTDKEVTCNMLSGDISNKISNDFPANLFSKFDSASRSESTWNNNYIDLTKKKNRADERIGKEVAYSRKRLVREVTKLKMPVHGQRGNHIHTESSTITKNTTIEIRRDKKAKNGADFLQMYETKKAVLEIYAEKTVTEKGECFVAKLPRFLCKDKSKLYENFDDKNTGPNFIFMHM